MRTRCPVCSTVFRITSEQLRAKAGKVRCGHCQSLFNAFDALLDAAPDTPPAPLSAPIAPVAATPPAEPAPAAALDFDAAATLAVAEPPREPAAQAISESPPAAEPAPEVVPAPLAPADTGEPQAASAAVADIEDAAQPADASAPEPTPEPAPQPLPPPESDAARDHAAPVESAETIEQSTLAAREAGLVAARELTETPAYNRWAASAVSVGLASDFDHDAARPARWPFTLAALLLLGVLASQLLHYFRTDVVLRFPAAATLFETLDVDVPLPRQAELVSIETSDLQSDNGRGLLVLQATLRNRAPYAQAWPALELTLTDTHDAVVSRRILAASDYLPPGTNPDTFAANAETGIRLWIEAKALGAAGYRLYVFYP